MAKAEIKKPPSIIILELTEDEAGLLCSIFQRVGGSPENSRRKYADSIRWALESVGVSYSTSDVEGGITLL